MVLSPLGDVDERRQTRVVEGGVILHPSNGMWMRQMDTKQVSLKKIGLACLLACLAAASGADERDQAKRIHDRIAGVPPDEATLTQMAITVRSREVIAPQQVHDAMCRSMARRRDALISPSRYADSSSTSARHRALGLLLMCVPSTAPPGVADAPGGAAP